MSRTISILLGIGLAILALVGCSKNNIAGPQALTENQGQVAADQLASEEESSRWAEMGGGKGMVYVRPAVLDEDGSSNRAKGAAVAEDDVIF